MTRISLQVQLETEHAGRRNQDDAEDKDDEADDLVGGDGDDGGGLGAWRARHLRRRSEEGEEEAPAFNVVMCNPNLCNGTRANDYLLGTNEGSDDIYGGEGDDVYNGKGGWDRWRDLSTTSNDTYLAGKIEAPFEAASITDDGGSSDKVDLRPYISTDLSSGTGTNHNGDLFIFLDGHNMVEINNQNSSPIEYFQFADKILTSAQTEAQN